MLRTLGWIGAGALAAACALPSPALAGPFSAVYVFGDSLSDTGNLAEALGTNFPNPPSYHDSFSNGPVAMERLAEHFGLRADPSLWVTGFSDVNHLGLSSGTNYAVAGATATDRGLASFPFDLPAQVSAFLARTGGHAPASGLYAMLIGGNDVRTAAHALNDAFVYSGVATEIAQLQRLVDAGARTLFVANLPDVGAIPEFTQESPPAQAAAAHADSLLYDSLLLAGVQGLEASNPGVTFDYFDLYDYAEGILHDAAALGFTNTTDPCYADTPASAAIATPACGPADPLTGAATNIDQFLYWDHIHPTAHQQALWANGFIAAVPEPASLALLGGGLAGLALARRRRG